MYKRQDQTLLTNKDGSSFLTNTSLTAVDIEQNSDGNIQLLAYREAGDVTKTITETISKRVKVGRKFKYVTQEVTSEVTEWSEGGFVLTTFDSFGNLIQETTELNPADDATYEAEKLFGIDLNKDNHQGRNVSQLDELLEIRNVGFNTFDDTANLTDLYADVNSGDLFFAAPGSTDYVELLDYDDINFGINVLDGYTPLAIEEISDPQYSGSYVLLAFDEYYRQLVGFMFDQDGSYISDLGSPEDHNSINQAEELFGVDINGDNHQGRNCLLYTSDAADEE